MFKRFLHLALFLLIFMALGAPSLGQNDCAFDGGHLQRALQHHQQGDFAAAYHQYRCALLERPDDESIPLLMETLFDEIASAAAAGAGLAAERHIPDWLRPYEMMPSPARPPNIQPQASFTRSTPFAAPATVQERPGIAIALVVRRLEAGAWMITGRSAAEAQLPDIAEDPPPSELGEACERGRHYAATGDYAAAWNEFQRLISLELGRCAPLERVASSPASLPAATDAPGLNLESAGFFEQARAFSRLEMWQDARDAFNKGLELEPNRVDVRCELGMIYNLLGDESAALREFDRALFHDAEDSCAWANRDALLQRLRDGGGE